MSQASRVLVYLLRRDLRLADNPIFHELARLNAQSQKPFTHVLPVYVFAAEQIEVSGFLAADADAADKETTQNKNKKSPYKEARSAVGGFWRCGKLRAKFIAESVWDLKSELADKGSGLELRVGSVQDAVQSILDGYRDHADTEVHGVWMTSEEGWEEKREEDEVRGLLAKEDKEFKLWTDEKYLVDDRDLPFQDPKELSDVFTSFRKTVEPLRDAPRRELPTPDSLPPLPDFIPPQASPFEIPDSLAGTIEALHKPLESDVSIPHAPETPAGAESAHPFIGGSAAGQERIRHLITSGAMSAYKDTRNGLLGLDFSTKLSAWLALGSISARQVHWRLAEFEDGRTELGSSSAGHGGGENKGTAAVRFELLWRDYMRLCTRKFGTRLFTLPGFRADTRAADRFRSSPYTSSSRKKNCGGANDNRTREAVERFLAGRTGTGLIDASMRELFLTGWTSNRARQNVASFLAKHLWIDWRVGAEWYEMQLVDYDVSSNWGNWQYVAGVGNDPRGDARVFNPVKQAVDYDPHGEYVRTWVPELREVGRGGGGGGGSGSGSGGSDDKESAEALMGLFQAWRLPADEKRRLGLEGVEWVEHPLIRIDFSINRRGGGRGRGRGGRGRGRGGRGDGGRSQRSGPMEKAGWQ